MPRIVNVGSVNIDHVYRVPHFVRPGETLAGEDYQRFPGGKGFNQSIALARAGARVSHAGCIGEDGLWLREMLRSEGVDTERLAIVDAPTGNAIIQVTPDGQNAILLHGAANQAMTPERGIDILAQCTSDDLLLMQNEIGAMPDIMACAGHKELPVILNPAPMSEAVLTYPLEHVSLLIVNEIEAAQFVGEGDPGTLVKRLRKRFPQAHVLLTLGARGVMAANEREVLTIPGFSVEAVDTTAAGDTFIGYFLAARTHGESLPRSLRRACAAAALCCRRRGAAAAIPHRKEVDAFLNSVSGPFSSTAGSLAVLQSHQQEP